MRQRANLQTSKLPRGPGFPAISSSPALTFRFRLQGTSVQEGLPRMASRCGLDEFGWLALLGERRCCWTISELRWSSYGAKGSPFSNVRAHPVIGNSHPGHREHSPRNRSASQLWAFPKENTWCASWKANLDTPRPWHVGIWTGLISNRNYNAKGTQSHLGKREVQGPGSWKHRLGTRHVPSCKCCRTSWLRLLSIAEDASLMRNKSSASTKRFQK